MDQVGKFTGSENSMFPFEPETSSPLQPVKQADEKDLTPASVAGLIKAQEAEAFCQSVAKKLGKVKTETTMNEKEVLVRRAHIDEALQMFAPQ